MDDDYVTMNNNFEMKENKVTNYYIHNEMKDQTLKKTENVKENDYKGDNIKENTINLSNNLQRQKKGKN
jgi:hypothetical protein